MNEKKITFIILGVLVIGLIISGLSSATYALFSVDNYGTNKENYSTGLLAIEAKSKSDTISLSNALPMTDEDGQETNPYVFTIKNIGNLDYEFDVRLLSTGSEETSFPPNLIKVQINDGEVMTLQELSINNDNKINTSPITLLAGETIDYSIRVWLSIETTNEYIGRTFESKIVTDGKAVHTSTNHNIALVKHIESLYDSAEKTEISQADGITYNYAKTESLMNDRLASFDVGANDGNIRYYGETPNNYIDIGDRTKSKEVIQYRIIGLFKNIELADGSKHDLIKIKKDSSIGKYSWDGSSINLENEWDKSDAMRLLNAGYESKTVNGSLWWNSGTGKCRTSRTSSIPCDFTSTGLSFDAQNKIETVVWNLGGFNNNQLYASEAYIMERGTSVYSGHATEWTGKVALMYPSDHAYAGEDFPKTNSARLDIWLYSSSKYWTLTPYSLDNASIYTGPAAGHDFSENTLDLYPTFYLKSDVMLIGGSGTETDPYVVS